MLKVVKGDRPDRPSSGLSDALWDLLMTTWVVQYAQKPQERPSVSTVLTRLEECVDDWGKLILSLVAEDWQDIGWCRMSQNDHDGLFMSLSQKRTMKMISQPRQVIFSIGLAILLLTGDLNDLACSGTDFAALVETFRWPWDVQSTCLGKYAFIVNPHDVTTMKRCSRPLPRAVRHSGYVLSLY